MLLEHRLVEIGCPKLNLLVRSENEAVAAYYARQGCEQLRQPADPD